jgi:putative membrane protein
MTKLTYLWIGALASVLAGGAALAGDDVSTARVLGRVHHANQTEVAMGKLAQTHGASIDVRKFGMLLVKDHTAADQQVMKLATAEKIDLAANTPALEMHHLGKEYTGSAFDDAFAKEMLAAHKEDVAALTTARDSTTDPKLKQLLDKLLPVLQKHQETAQQLVDARAKTRS